MTIGQCKGKWQSFAMVVFLEHISFVTNLVLSVKKCKEKISAKCYNNVLQRKASFAFFFVIQGSRKRMTPFLFNFTLFNHFPSFFNILAVNYQNKLKVYVVRWEFRSVGLLLWWIVYQFMNFEKSTKMIKVVKNREGIHFRVLSMYINKIFIT